MIFSLHEWERAGKKGIELEQDGITNIKVWEGMRGSKK